MTGLHAPTAVTDALTAAIYTAPTGASLPLQVTSTTDSAQVFVVLVTFLLSALLGLVIARKAFQGYRRNASKPMLFLAAGIVLLTAVPAVLSLFLSNFTGLPSYQVVLVTNGSELLGLLAIAYSLYGRF
ncbi:hypothetical protein SAMN04487949_3422 [Halogranum gelatinilyticum]|uniref:Uncharacterized protein n=1 Tax=Halogranum gelatinilyticum TaxID=660521 RepID=A0A1G9YR75_9EURY|nr:hypothetical protein [Halogranum gelatinilyticum]SDN11550.1 hypothetical protein SAMN04487949_3422 [Halogranum gelatinilyticum]